MRTRLAEPNERYGALRSLRPPAYAIGVREARKRGRPEDGERGWGAASGSPRAAFRPGALGRRARQPPSSPRSARAAALRRTVKASVPLLPRLRPPAAPPPC